MALNETTADHIQPDVEVSAVKRSVDGERLIAVFSALVEPIGRSLPASSEVVLHDLSLLPDSIVAIHGDVTGRQVGDPATNLLLQKAVSGSLEHQVGYETTLPDGRRMKSSTMVIRDVAGTPVAALCINTDLSHWYSVQRIARMMIGEEPTVSASSQPTAPSLDVESETARTESNEVFAHDVDELAAHLIHQAVQKTGVPVDLMQKKHKVAVVRDLKARGMFLLRDAVDMIATSLGVTRFTIYNYLNEINDATDD
jgi:predicted transcriptional regulator YheO